ncbi:MAG: 4-hydroxy-tetrahydrodipicolinate synthase family protein [Thermoplasmata archaeon]
MYENCTTALVTPFKNGSLDKEGLRELIEFQKEEGTNGILVSGTTGESPTLTHDDWEELLKILSDNSSGIVRIAGTGGNSFSKSLKATAAAYEYGFRSALLVDPYYNGPSSLEIRNEYVGPLARKFPEMSIIPYIIPGRSGTQLLPQDLAILKDENPNIRAVKEATGDLDNMRLTRELCGDDFEIISGDDGKTLEMMTDEGIRSCGVVSVASNIFPREVTRLTEAILGGRLEEARRVNESLKPIFGIITIETEESTSYGNAIFRARNPLPVKSLMNILGMPSGNCRRPLGKLTRAALSKLVDCCKESLALNRDMFNPIEEHFGVDADERLTNKKYMDGLFYEGY